MNIKELRENLSSMSEGERAAAEALLESLGIDYKEKERKAKPTRKTFTSKLEPYAERIHITCRTCGNEYDRHFLFVEHFRNHQYVLLSKSVAEAEYELSDLPKLRRGSFREVCKCCAERLALWSKEELIATLLNLRVGGEYKRISVEEENV